MSYDEDEDLLDTEDEKDDLLDDMDLGDEFGSEEEEAE